MQRTTVAIAILLFAVQGCSLFRERNQEDPVARVFETYLYPSDLADALPRGTALQDSAILAKRYIDTWVKEQLMKYRAEQELTDEQKDFRKQMDEYYRSLLIYTFRQKLLQQKLDTVVDTGEISDYYQENLSNFILGEDVIRGTFIRVPLSAPGQADLRRWSRSNSEEDLDQMEKYSMTHAEKFTDFNNEWTYFSSISVQIPLQISQPTRYLTYNKNIETTDSQYRYFLHVSGHLAEGEVAPLDMVSDDIRNIILNKRKIEFFHDLEQIIYNDAVSRNQFEIYQ